METRDSGDDTPERPESDGHWNGTDWQNIDEKRRARDRQEAAGASRDLASELLAGGGA